MRIVSIQSSAAAEYRYRNAAPGSRGTVVVSLPVLHGVVDGLPAGVDAVVMTSDLQGRELAGRRLLGEVVPGMLLEGGHVDRRERVVALLAGDLYASPGAELRGATGDVREVWRAFANSFAAVAGVCGNHDTFGEQSPADFARTEAVTILDGDLCDVAGLRVAGVSGIVGKLSKPNRKDEQSFSRMVDDVLLSGADVVLLHQGPQGNGPRDKGSPAARASITAMETPPLVAFGHCHWEVPLLEEGGRQMLNLDGRVVVLRAA